MYSVLGMNNLSATKSQRSITIKHLYQWRILTILLPI
ncbi:unnamed protein product [Brassica napus]|uniref:(rape) hypothetical protein n=1 Tax=Brassica napus TaxID=3708 RepID=A0A816IPT9_BRANA|nr:unnamed protein product [Brassica napus]